MTDFMQLCELSLGEVNAGDVIAFPLFPIGNWKSAKYPSLPLTRELADELIANFEAGVLGTEPVLDSSGKHDTSAPAAGWFKRLHVEPLQSGGEMLFGDCELTDLGAEALSAGLYKYGSLEIDKVVDNRSGAETPNVFKSATLTNTPVLRIMPAVLDAAEHIAVALSEITAADDPDPVQELLADLEAIASKLDENLKGKKGMPSARAFLRELRSKVSAYALVDNDTSDSDPAAASPAVSRARSHDAKGEEGDGMQMSEGSAAQKGADQTMKTVLEALKLSEGVDEATVLAAVNKVIAERDEATLALSEANKVARTAAVEVTLSELIKGGHVAPGQKDTWLALAEAAPEQFDAMAETAKQHKVIDLGEHGSSDGGSESTKPADVELAEKTRARMASDSVDFATAKRLVLSEDPDLKTRYEEFRAGKEG